MKATSNTRGRFITLEGGEGVGKSSNLFFIEQYLMKHPLFSGTDLCMTREPGGTPLAEEIRQLFVQPREEKVHEDTELLLVFAARAQHIAGLIEPSLAQGRWVLSDRFTDATFAYQGGGRGLSMETIMQLQVLIQKDLNPDLTFLLDVPVELGLARARARDALDRIEQEEVAFFERIRSTYLQRARDYPERFVVIDASVELELVQEQIAAALDDFLENIKQGAS